MWLVQVKSLHGAGLVKEIIDEEINTETWWSTKDSGQTKGHTICLFEYGIFTSLFGFTIKRDWIAWGILVADALDNTIAWASRGVDDTLLGTEPLDKLLNTSLIQSDGKLGLLFTSGIADNSGQVNDNIVLLDQGLVAWSVENITLDNGQIGMVQNAEKWLSTPAENVVNGDLVKGLSILLRVKFNIRAKHEDDLKTIWLEATKQISDWNNC